jgi:hypothetical protein
MTTTTNPKTTDTNCDQFLFPRSRYYGEFKPEQLVFNANLQEFAQRVGYLANLQTAGKLSARDAYQKLENLWHELQQGTPAHWGTPL